MSLRVVEHRSGADLLRRAGPLLEQAETENSLMLGILASLGEGRGEAYLASVEEGETLVAVAVRTPPYNLLLSRAPEAALSAVAADLRARKLVVPGVSGPEESASAFADVWARAAAVRPRMLMRQRGYALRQVKPPRPVAGGLRPAEASEMELLSDWGGAFARDALLPAAEVPALRREVGRRAEAGSLFVWDDGGPVSMASATGPTPRGVRVALVYTPPDRRGRGYASACVAALSQRMLDAGKSFCFLFADLANPTSNGIYVAIGYEPVSDFAMILFEAP